MRSCGLVGRALFDVETLEAALNRLQAQLAACTEANVNTGATTENYLRLLFTA